MTGSGALSTQGLLTYAGHPISLAAGLERAGHSDTEREELFAIRATELGARLLAGLREVQTRFPEVLTVRGGGRCWGWCSGADRQSFKEAGTGCPTRRGGLGGRMIVYPGSGAEDGVRGDHLLLGPQLTSPTCRQISCFSASWNGPLRAALGRVSVGLLK